MFSLAQQNGAISRWKLQHKLVFILIVCGIYNVNLFDCDLLDSTNQYKIVESATLRTHIWHLLDTCPCKIQEFAALKHRKNVEKLKNTPQNRKIYVYFFFTKWQNMCVYLAPLASSRIYGPNTASMSSSMSSTSLSPSSSDNSVYISTLCTASTTVSLVSSWVSPTFRTCRVGRHGLGCCCLF